MKVILFKVSMIALLFSMSANVEAIFGIGSEKKMLDKLTVAAKKAFPVVDYKGSNYTAWNEYLKELAKYVKSKEAKSKELDKKLDKEYKELSAISEGIINTRKILWNRYKGKVSAKDMNQINQINTQVDGFSKRLSDLGRSTDTVIEQTAFVLHEALSGILTDPILTWKI